MSILSNWWSGKNVPPPTDDESAAAESRSISERAALAAARKAQIRDEEPRTVSILKRTLARRGRRAVARLVYTARVEISPAELRSGQLEPQLQVPCVLVNSEINVAEAVAAGVRAYTVSIEVVEADTRQMPFSTAWRAAPGERDAFIASANTHWRATQRRGSSRKIPSKPLLTQPISVEEPALNIQFTSFEAIGFSGENLMQNVAMLMPGGSYKIAMSYAYSGLLRNVHSACVLAEQKRTMSALDIETAPVSAYQVQHDDTHMLMPGEDLQRAMKYITERLASANPVFDFQAFMLQVEPFGGHKWLDIWETALDVAVNRAAVEGGTGPARVAAQPPPISATVTVVVYIALVPANGFENGFAMRAAAAAVISSNHATSSTATPIAQPVVSATYERRDMATYNGVMTMELAHSNSEEDDENDDDDGDADAERTARSTSVKLVTAAPQAPSDSEGSLKE